MNHIIDAKGKAIGRVATQVATILMGKHRAEFAKNTVLEDTVTIINSKDVRILPKKAKTVMHERYSGHPGGLKMESIEQVIAKKGHAELFKLAVYGMLPANKLRAKRMKNLIIE